MLGPAGTGTFGGCDHTAGGWTAFLAHAYAWPSPGELAGTMKDLMPDLPELKF